MSKEPEITINGQKLTHGESMPVHVAVTNLDMDLQHTGFGNDKHGKKMVERMDYSYRRNARCTWGA